MTFLINLGDKFKINNTIQPDGCIILASSITMHTLERRTFGYSHLVNRFFDPQLYMAGLDPIQSSRFCARMASYPWFGVTELNEYDSDEQVQKSWLDEAEMKIAAIWPRTTIDILNDKALADEVIRECIDFQIRIGCKGIILPSPLTYDSSSDYTIELTWLDLALEYIKQIKNFDIPVFATVALTDNCLRYTDPINNPLLNIILDSVGARSIDGVYIVFEQNGESNLTRHISHAKVLESALHMVYVFKHDVGIQVGVNFFGAFGLVLQAAGANFWAANWYKSHYRLRLADKLGGGPAYPSCWATNLLADIDLKVDFDRLAKSKMINGFVIKTNASDGLLSALSVGKSVSQVPAWQYNPSNVTAAKEHFLESVVIAEQELQKYVESDRLNFVQTKWLEPANNNCANVAGILGKNPRTNTEHVQAWRDAVVSFRRDHNL